MKIKLIKIKQGYYDLAYLDAVSSLKNYNNNNIIELSYSNKKAQSVAKKNLNYFNTIFPEISKAMNQHHNVSLSNDFWRILIGPWLIKSIEYFYDKYIILDALPKGKKYKIKGFNYKNFNFNNIYDLYLNENFINYSINILNLNLNKNKKIIKLKNNKERSINNRILKYQKNSNYLIKLIKYKIRKIIFYFFLKKEYQNKIININLPLDKKNLKNISDKNNNLYDHYIYFLDKIAKKNKSKVVNHKITKFYRDEFLNSFKKFILDFLPIEFNDYFDSYYEIYTNKVKSLNPSTVLVRSPHETLPQIRYFLATLKEKKKTNIISFQEGGIGKYSYQQFYEKFSLIGTDYFFQWSKYKTERKVVNFFLTKTFWLRNYTFSNKNNIIFILGSFRKFFFSSYEGHLPDYSFRQLEIISELLDENNIKCKTTIRFHKDFGFKEKNFLISKYKNLKVSTREEVTFFYELLENYSLKIFFSDYTANMQSFIINHPTILIWDKKFLKPNQKYDQIYKKLEKSNILFYSTKKLKKFINEKIDSFEKLINWWNSNDVQNAKNFYLKSLCRHNENLKSNFIHNINSIRKCDL